MSGDITLHGELDDALLKTASGDIETDGLIRRFLGSSMSGDLHVETSQLPEVMEMSTKSGDCEARIPDGGPSPCGTRPSAARRISPSPSAMSTALRSMGTAPAPAIP